MRDGAPIPRPHRLIVRDHDEAIAWFTQKLGFTLVEDLYGNRWDLIGPAAA